MRDTFVFYSSLYTSSLHLDKKERGEFLECVIEYSLTGELKEIPNGVVRAMFESCKVNIDKQITNYKNGAKPKQKRSETKAKPKRNANYKEKEKEKEKYIIPNGINIHLWEEFEQHRKEIRKPLSDLARKKLHNFLLNNLQEQEEIINQSIANRWAGLFTVKKQNIKKSNDTNSTIDKFFNNQNERIIDARID